MKKVKIIINKLIKTKKMKIKVNKLIKIKKIKKNKMKQMQEMK